MKNVLLSTLGGSPKTVTQMFQKLWFEKIEIAEIHVLKTRGSRTVPELYRPPVLWQEHGTDSMDIRTEQDAKAIADLIFRTLLMLKQRPDVGKVVLDLTGGRKEMSSYLMLCAQLLCSEQDEMYHVEVNDEKSPLRDPKHPDFATYYYPQSPQEVTLIHVPFVRLHHLFRLVGATKSDSCWDYLEQSRQCLERLALTGLLSAGVDHEILAPLSEAYNEAPQIHDALKEIEGIFHTFARVVKPEKLNRERERVALPELINRLRKMVTKRLDDLVLVGKIPDIAVAGSDVLLLRVLWILVKNAKKHGAATEVQIAVREQGPTVTLEIGNNGSPMEPHVAAEAFQVFKSYQPPDDGEQVGLPTVKALMKAMGGGIDLGDGGCSTTVFRLVLPKY